MSNQRSVLIVSHPTREDARAVAGQLAGELKGAGIAVFSNNSQLLPDSQEFAKDSEIDIAVVLGGDGTILRAAELVHSLGTPILGINLGNVGFLAQLERPTIDAIIQAVLNQGFHIEPRLTVEFQILRGATKIAEGWGLNEISIERGTNQMAELFLQIDGRPLSRWGCDGIICATPTGSTAYAFSAGGPVVWPEVDALVLLPLAAHALFSRPMVISPKSKIIIDIESQSAELSADGMRRIELQHGDRIELSSGSKKINLAYLENGVFTDRLVAKFKLPVEGWRGGES